MRHHIPAIPALAAVIAAGCVASAPAALSTSEVARPSARTDAAAARVNELADTYLRERMIRSPELATRAGLAGARHGEIFDNSIAALRAWEEREDRWLEELTGIDPGPIHGTSAALTYGVLREELESLRAMRACRSHLWGVSHYAGLQVVYTNLATLQPVGTEELRRQALSRFGRLPAYVDTEIANLREGLRAGYSAPRAVVERTIPQLDELIGMQMEKSPFFDPATRDSTAGFREDWRVLVSTRIGPALQRYRDFLKNEYLPAARADIGVSAVPSGPSCYRAAIRRYTTLDLSPEELFQRHTLGVEQSEQRMREIASRSFNRTDVWQLLRELDQNPDQSMRSRDEVIPHVRTLIQRAESRMPELFGRLPRSPLELRPTPSFREATASTGQYLPPSEDGSRPGVYWVNLLRASEPGGKPALERLTFHEALPGHHLQLSLAHERKDAHPLTRLLGNSGFSEGWGIYAEQLADEHDMFSSDTARLVYLSGAVFTHASIVAEVGMHAMGWTRPQAIGYITAHSRNTPERAAPGVDRRIALPGQGLSYQTGATEIVRLREMARAELGARFDLREFHDRVLEEGSITLPMLERKIVDWIRTRR